MNGRRLGIRQARRDAAAAAAARGARARTRRHALARSPAACSPCPSSLMQEFEGLTLADVSREDLELDESGGWLAVSLHHMTHSGLRSAARAQSARGRPGGMHAKCRCPCPLCAACRGGQEGARGGDRRAQAADRLHEEGKGGAHAVPAAPRCARRATAWNAWRRRQPAPHLAPPTNRLVPRPPLRRRCWATAWRRWQWAAASPTRPPPS